MIKKFLLVCLLVVMGATAGILTAPAQAGGGVRCQTYACQSAQQEIQYLLNAIYWEQQKTYPNWPAIQQAQARIQWLRTIK